MRKLIDMDAKDNRVCVALLGVGGIGRVVLEQLQDLSRNLAKGSKPQHINLVYLANSRACLTSKDYSNLPQTALDELTHSSHPSLSAPELRDYLLQSQSPSILLDCTASPEIASAYPLFLRSGIHIVTPNKKGFAGPQALFDDIHAAISESDRRSHIFYEASAGAGLPLLSTLTELSRTGDELWQVEGVFSGTMSFLFNAFMPGSSASSATKALRPKWSAIVREAAAEGYTEPDPRADLSGLDVARKLTIIARTLSVVVSEGPSGIPTQGVIPEALEDCKSGEEFLRRLPEFDDEMEGMRDDAEKEGKVLRFVGSVDLRSEKFEVGVKKFDKLDPIATLKGSEKFVKISSKRFGHSSLIIQGGDANLALTAMSVIGDLIKVLDRLR